MSYVFVRGLGILVDDLIDPIARVMADSPIGREVDRQSAIANKPLVDPNATQVAVEVQTTTVSFPWRIKDANTINLQSIVNAYLAGVKMCPLTVDGKLGGATCGAIKYLVANGADAKMPTECVGHESEFVAPKKNVDGCNVQVRQNVASLTRVPGTVAPAGMSTGVKIAIGVTLSMAVVAFLMRK